MGTDEAGLLKSWLLTQQGGIHVEDLNFIHNEISSLKEKKKKTGESAGFLLDGAYQYEPFAIFCFFASFLIELNEVGTSIKKSTSLILCDYLKILLVRRKT